MIRGLIRLFMTLTALFFVLPVYASSLVDIQVNNAKAESTVVLTFKGQPQYAFATHSNPNRVVVDVNQSQGVIQGLPLNFNGQNMVKRVRSGQAKDSGSIQLIFELTQAATTRATTKQSGENYHVTLVIKAKSSATERSTPKVASEIAAANVATTNGNTTKKSLFTESAAAKPAVERKQDRPIRRINDGSGAIVIAIDAGHGGKDSGAVGQNGLQEKKVTLSVARKLKALLDNDPAFKGVLTRDGDYFLSVMGRSDVARNKNAHLLVSIHADAAPNRSATGASVWVLSNKRANTELGRWLEQHEKQSELLGGAGDVLANSESNLYLSQTVLDLQFGHSQRVGYDVAVKILAQMGQIGSLHKRHPEHASLGVLRSPDIPSVLVETGFISNNAEERLLGSSAFQDKLARAIYLGIRNYYAAHPVEVGASTGGSSTKKASTSSAKPSSATAKQIVNSPTQIHIVKTGETLSRIASSYKTSMSTLRELNTLKKDGVWIGQRLKVPAGVKPQVTQAKQPVKAPVTKAKTIKHTVVKGDTLSAISARYGVSAAVIRSANKLKSDNVPLGRKLTIPQS